MKRMDVVAFLPLVFLLGFGIGVVGVPRDEEPPHPVVRVWTNHAHHVEMQAVAYQWRIWTETAAANGECIGHVLPGREPL